MKNITINKTEIAMLKGLGYNPTSIAKHYGITLVEAINTLKSFGLYKTKTKSTVAKDYTITLVDNTTGTNHVVETVEEEELETA